MFHIDWQKTFVPSVSIAEIVLRGTVVYLFLFILLRLVHKRQAGAVGITDMLVVVLLADAAQNAMANEYKSLTDGLILVCTIVFWSYALDWLAYRFPRLARFIQPPPLLLIQRGKMQPENMTKELITPEELKSQLRQQGIEEVAKVKAAFMEGDGQISVIQEEEQQHAKREQPGI